jgi:hypothetical protein
MVGFHDHGAQLAIDTFTITIYGSAVVRAALVVAVEACSAEHGRVFSEDYFLLAAIACSCLCGECRCRYVGSGGGAHVTRIAWLWSHAWPLGAKASALHAIARRELGAGGVKVVICGHCLKSSEDFAHCCCCCGRVTGKANCRCMPPAIIVLE